MIEPTPKQVKEEILIQLTKRLRKTAFRRRGTPYNKKPFVRGKLTPWFENYAKGWAI